MTNLSIVSEPEGPALSSVPIMVSFPFRPKPRKDVPRRNTATLRPTPAPAVTPLTRERSAATIVLDPGGAFSRTRPCSAGAQPDQPGILHRRLAMLDRLAVNRIAKHRHEGGDVGILGDEAEIPALLLGADQHQFERAPPDDRAAERGEHRLALAAE